MIKPRHLLSVLCASAAMLVTLPNYASENTGQPSCSFPVLINKADQQTFTCLSKVGEKKAKNIVDYRTKKANGQFDSLDELTKVSGITTAMVEQWEKDKKIALK